MGTSIQQFQIDQPFILEDGSINPDALGGTGFTRAEGAYPNSIGFNSITPDKNDYTFVENLEVRGGVINHTQNAGTIRTVSGSTIEEQINNAGGEYKMVTNPTFFDSNGNGWWFLRNTTHPFGASAGFGSGVRYLQIQNDDGYSFWGTDKSNSTAFIGTLIGKWQGTGVMTTNADMGLAVIQSRNATHSGNANLYANSVIVGGSNLVIDKSNYAFMQNAELQGGVLNHDKASGTTRNIGQGNNEEYLDGSGNYLLNNGTTSGGYQRAWQLMTNTDHWIGYGQSGGGNGTCMRVESNKFDLWVTNQLGTLWTNSNSNTGGATDCAGISTKNSFVNGGTYSNSVILGGTGVSIDKSNYAFMQNAEIQGGVLRHDRATGTTRQIGQGNVVEQVAANSYYLIDTNNGNFANSWLELINTSQSAIGYNTSNITVLNGRINLELDYSAGGVGTKDVELVDVARTTTNIDKGVIALCSRNSVLNGNVRTNVAVLGGIGITVDKDDYAYAQNLEVQGGIAAYTVDPTTNGAWGARSIPDRQYVDDSVGGLQSAADWSGITNVVTDRAFDANSTTINELADALGTLVADLRAVGILA